MDPEESLIRTFVAPERQSRLLALLSNPKRRRKLTGGLAHFHALDPRCVVEIPPQQQSAQGIEALLRQYGAPTVCHVLSEASAIDGREMRLSEALAEVVGRGMGTILSCVPGQLGYFESEEPGQRVLLRAPAA